MVKGWLGLRLRLMYVVVLALLPAVVLLAEFVVYHQSRFPVALALLGLLLAVVFVLLLVWHLLTRLIARPIERMRGEITHARAQERFAKAQEEVLTLIAGGAPLAESLQAIVLLIEKSTPQNSPPKLCSLLLVQGQHLQHGAAPSLPESFVQAIEGLSVAEGVGACGTAAFRRQAVVVEDTQLDPLMSNYRELVHDYGLRACWSTPVQAASGEVLATFAVYMRSPGRPQPRDLELITTATRLARIALERSRAEAALVSSNRAMQMLSRSSVALNRIDDEKSLLAEVCRVAVEVGNYRMAWVGYAQNDEARSILPMASAGNGEAYLQVIQLSWSADVPTGRGPAGQVIRTGQSRQSGDIRNGDNHFYYPQAALQQGFRSALFLPLRNPVADELRTGTAEATAPGQPPGGMSTFGVICMYSGQVQHFLDEEVRLLQELADNLAFGISSLRARLERRRSQEAARQAAAKVREQASLLDRSHDAILVRNLDKTIRYWNKGAERLYGWSAEEVLGQTMAQSMYTSPQVLDAAMSQVLASDGDWIGELQQRVRDGSELWVEARWTVVRDEQGVVNGVLGINTDIRERRRARQDILRLNASLEGRVRQRTAELEFANEQLESFSYSVSHDLRTPLSSIAGFADLLGKTLAKPLDSTRLEYSQHCLTRIKAGVNQMGALIDAMLSLAHISRADLRCEPVDLSAIASTLLAGYCERQPDRNTRLQVEPGLMTLGDPRLLHQVLDNLLGNAWKFSAAKAVTEISFGREAICTDMPPGVEGPEFAYFVRDRGAGFDMAYADKLFGAFQRLHSPSEFAGSGIGLTTVQRIVSRHGGKIWGRGEPGVGATFYFTLKKCNPQGSGTGEQAVSSTNPAP